ncbi:FAD-binding oxidoreductase [Flexivirga alba]|uniref:FAD-binding oxidoreductase n=1 Tax=Flexivirga alba TaxID=702742 RepID=A0ABW2ANE0_9MICO
MVANLTTLPDSLVPGDVGYDDAAQVLFAKGRPAIVIRPSTRGEVADAVLHARRSGLEIAVRSGGHGLLGHGTSDGGVVLDLARLDHVDVLDVERRLVRIGGGARWGQVDEALRPLGWAISSGDTAGVGVGGLTLGGGFGWLLRKHGLAIDNLVAARVVLADGTMVATSEAQHPELFWALRGGGGNFGVVVDFDFMAAEVATVQFGEIAYQPSEEIDLLAGWRDVMREAPTKVTSAVTLLPAVGSGEPTAMVRVYVADCDADAADRAIEPFLGIGSVIRATIKERAYGDLLEPGAAPPPGLRMVGRNTLVRELDAATLDALHRFRRSSPSVAVTLRSLGGAYGEVPCDATAFAHRDAEAMILGMPMVPQPDRASQEEAVLTAWGDVAAHGSGVYLNFQSSATPADLAAAYPPATYARLVAVKREYDPDNVFARNHNVAP